MKYAYMISRSRPFDYMSKTHDPRVTGGYIPQRGNQTDRASFVSEIELNCKLIKEAHERYPNLVPQDLATIKQKNKNGIDYLKSIGPVINADGQDCDLYIYEWKGKYEY